MASLAATNWPKPLVLVPCLSWSTASAVFTQGVMSHSIPWEILETQYFTNGHYRERLSKMVTVVDDAFLAGQHFIQNFNQSVEELRQDITDANMLTCDVPDSDVHLTVVRETTPETERSGRTLMTSNKMEINRRSNVLNLSEPLLNKLLSDVKCELTTDEINELNEKIQNAMKRYNDTHQNGQKADTIILEVKAEEKPSQADSKSMTTKIMDYIRPSKAANEVVPTVKREKIDTTKIKWYEREALQFMRGIMDECTHLKNFSVPYDTSLIIAVAAKDDAYVPREGCSSLEEIWPGAEVRYLDAGHISAYVLHQKLFRSCIIEAFERAKKKWVPVSETPVPTETASKETLN